MKRKICIVMKSGYSFNFLCDKFKIKTLENKLMEYSSDGLKGSRPMYVRMEDVDAIIDECEVEECE